MNLSYSYDLAGNITLIVDGKMGPQTQSFTYDEMDRLTSAEASGGPEGNYNESYTYNSSTGNLASKGGVSYTYGDSDHKHAVTSLSSSWTYQYDENGNMTERIVGSSTYSLTYDAYNHLISVSGAASVDFVYDGDGQRVKVGGTVYIGDYYRYYGSGCTTFYFADGKRIALRFNTGSQANNYYYLSDHLNSSTVLVNEDRSYIGREGYKAWGETRFGNVGLHFKFTGQYYVSNIGLYHFGARFYDPVLGRFTQADTLVPEGVQGSQAWDRYAYVNNNPVRYTDPSGNYLYTDDEDYPPLAPEPSSRNSPKNLPGDDVCKASLSDCFGDTVFLKDFSEYGEDNPIPIEEFEDFADRIAEDLNNHDLTWPGFIAGRDAYDTPFYNGGQSEKRGGNPDGIWPAGQQVCIETLGCSGRSEINYIAQGMWGAAVGEPKWISIIIVRRWKAVEYGEAPSDDTLFWLQYGYDYYQNWLGGQDY